MFPIDRALSTKLYILYGCIKLWIDNFRVIEFYKETARNSVQQIRTARENEAKGRRKPRVAKGVLMENATPKKAATAKKTVKTPFMQEK